MATNTEEKRRNGSVRGVSQIYNPKTDKWVKNDASGKLINVKKDGEPYKGVKGKGKVKTRTLSYYYIGAQRFTNTYPFTGCPTINEGNN